MTTAIIVGSMQRGSQSLKVAKQVQQRLQQVDEKTELVDLFALNLPMWSTELTKEQLEPVDLISQKLQRCDALVVISPEYHGMVPASLKNFFLFFSGGQLAHKPGLIISVSAGDGGANPVNELRTSSYKNSRINYIPEHLIIRHVTAVFNDSDNDPKSQPYLSARMDYCLWLLSRYRDALSQVRQQLPKGDYPNGMS